jgi:hypothetical protein
MEIVLPEPAEAAEPAEPAEALCDRE